MRSQDEGIQDFRELFNPIKFTQFDHRFTGQSFIGKGSGSQVFEAYDKQHKDRKVALKRYNKVQLAHCNQIDIIREITLLEWLNKIFPGRVPEFYGAYSVQKQNSGIEYYTVMEWCFTSLDKYIKSPNYKDVSEKDRIILCLQIARGVQCLHSKSIIHRDLKPANIFYSHRNSRMVPLIGDYGHAKILEIGVENTISRGTLKYANPQKLYDKEYGLEYDIYPIGVIFLQIMTGGKYIFQIPVSVNTELKFHKKSLEELKKLKQNLDPIEIHVQMKALIWQCMKNLEFTIGKITQKIEQILLNYQTQPTQEQKFQNFQKNKKHYSEIAEPSELPKNIKEKVSTIESSTKQIPDMNDYHQQDTARFQQPKEFSKQSQSDIIPSTIEFKEQSRVSSEIVASKIEKNEDIFYSFMDEDQSDQSQQIHETPKMEKIFSFRTPQQLGKRDESSESYMVLPKLFKQKQKLYSQLEQQNSVLAELEKMKQFQEKLQNLKKIQQANIEPKHQKKLMLLGLLYLIAKARIYQEEYPNCAKYADIFITKLTNIKEKLKDQYLNRYHPIEGSIGMQVLKAHSPTIQDIREEFEKSLRRTENIEAITRLKKLLMK